MSVEKLYEAVKSGRVDPSQLNDKGKAELKRYIQSKNTPSPPANMGLLRKNDVVAPPSGMGGLRASDAMTSPVAPSRTYGSAGAPVDVIPESFQYKHPTASKVAMTALKPIDFLATNPFTKRVAQSANETRFIYEDPNKADIGSGGLNTAADLTGGILGFLSGGELSAGGKAFDLGVQGLKGVSSRLPSLPTLAGKISPRLAPAAAKVSPYLASGAEMGAGGVAYEGIKAGSIGDSFTPEDAAKIGLENFVAGLIFRGAGAGVDLLKGNLSRRAKEEIFDTGRDLGKDISSRKPFSAMPGYDINNARAFESGKGFSSTPDYGFSSKYLGAPARSGGTAETITGPAINKAQVQMSGNTPKLLRTPDRLSPAMEELQRGIEEAQNYVRHNDVLAAFKPGTTVEEAYANIKANTGIDLPQLMKNVELETSRPGLRQTAQQQAQYGSLRRAAGLGPTQLSKTGLPVRPLGKMNVQRIEPQLPPPFKRVEEPPTLGPRPFEGRQGFNTRTTPAEVPPIPQTQPKIPPKVVPVNGGVDSFRAKINRTPEKPSKFRDFVENFRTQFVDDLAPLEKLEKGVQGKIASAEDSLYKTARLFKGVPTKANQYVRDNLVPVIDNLEKAGYNYKDLGDYALAVHARDVNAKGLKSGFTNDEIKAVLDKFGTPEMEAARQRLVKVSTNLLDELASSGVIEAGLPKILREKWPNYMPLFRHFDDDKIEFAGGLGKALANVTSPIKTLKGSERDVVDPIESMVKNIFKTVNAADRNRVVSQLGRLADEDTTGQFVRRLAPGENRDRLNTVYERINGEKVYYEVQPDVYKAIMDMDRESANFLIKMLQKPASVLRAGATLVPEFSFRNPMRDVVQAYVVSKSGFNPIIDFPRALLDVIMKKDVYKQWLRDSGGYGNLVSMDRNVHREVLSKVIKEPPSQKFVNVVSGKSLIGVLRAIADASESATKLGEYKAAIRSGATPQEAAYRARDLMDFARAGVSVRQANRIVAFLNANIQGKSKLLRAIRENPGRVTVKALTAVTMPTVAEKAAYVTYANEEQRRTIDDAPTWLKDTFWLIPVPGTNQVARIPKPFDLAVAFSNPVSRALDYIIKNDRKAFDGFVSQTLSQLSIPVMLTGLAPFVEGMANYSFFRQGPIIPERERDLNYPDQYDIRTSETAKFIGRGVNKVTGGEGAFQNFGSPRVIDNTIRGLTAGLGTYATSAIDTLLEATGAVDKPAKPSRKVSELPLLRAFLVNENASGRTMSELYDTREKLTRAQGSAKSNKQPFKEAGKLKFTQQTTKQIGDITKAIRQVENNPTMSPQEKRRRIDELNKRRNDLARAAASKL